MKDKRFKDPLYGYVYVPADLVSEVIDTAEFQRLRRIVQTSYTPLYSSAVHNRFVHSIGVYHLGCVAAQSLETAVSEKQFAIPDEVLTHFSDVFRKACLLHDVGHAPYSHTGEAFYVPEKSDYSMLHRDLAAAVGTESFKRDIPAHLSDSAAPHEIMSAVLGLRRYGDRWDPAEREFFARCIVGYPYSVSNDELSQQIQNCYISLLNSKVIDVDKLDYLMRDAYMTGYRTVSIDNDRLLDSISIAPVNGRLQIVYKKSALSVLENIVYAHDSERKWIQTHPVVLYEASLLQRVMRELQAHLDDDEKHLFSLESLSVEGQRLKGNVLIRLLSDDDIICLAKNEEDWSEATEEFFERGKRRHPLWKTEAEYSAYVFSLAKGGLFLERFEKAMSNAASYLEGSSDFMKVDESALDVLKADLEKLKKGLMRVDEKTRKTQLLDKRLMLAVFTCLQRFAHEKGVPFDFVILSAKQFGSGFNNSDFADLRILFASGGDKEDPKRFGEIASPLTQSVSTHDEFFYLFYKRPVGKSLTDADAQELCRRLIYDVNSAADVE